MGDPPGGGGGVGFCQRGKVLVWPKSGLLFFG